MPDRSLVHQSGRSVTYPWRDASLCESRGPIGEFCQEQAGHDSGHHCLKGAGSVAWFKDYPYWNGRVWVRPGALDEQPTKYERALHAERTINDCICEIARDPACTWSGHAALDEEAS